MVVCGREEKNEGQQLIEIQNQHYCGFADRMLVHGIGVNGRLRATGCYRRR